MLFHVKQTHLPQDCPYGKGGSSGLFDRNAPGVKLITAVSDRPAD